ncbi:MAG: fibronectin-binding protein (FBP), partial [Bacteroidales bacterium]|nr:fibronectin-binding protein (FBP) [Bacteroidales bacterium]
MFVVERKCLTIINWSKENVYKIKYDEKSPENPDESDSIRKQREAIEPWLTALFQSENLSLLVGNGLTKAVAKLAGAESPDMSMKKFSIYNDKINEKARITASYARRGEPNFEDQIRVASRLIYGLNMVGFTRKAKELEKELNRILKDFILKIGKTEAIIMRNVKKNYKSEKSHGESIFNAIDYLVSFLYSFSSRVASRERLNIFTTNYDRLIEYAADWAGIRLIDRFVGTLTPHFRTSRMNIDFHYNPPGIRGEPRYLEGVARYTKLHGSIDWYYQDNCIIRRSLPFGELNNETLLPEKPADTIMVFPNEAKDRETADYPYVELFRDYAATICKPNSVLVTYGYSFGDEHINRVIKDMLTIPSTHLLIISYDNPWSRVSRFVNDVTRPAQIS